MRALKIVIPLLLLSACAGEAEQPAPPPLAVEVVTISGARIPNVIELPGRVTAVRKSEVRARVTGILEQQLLQDGSYVREGQPLFRIDPRELRASLAQSQASLQRAQATAANARAVVERYRPLVAENAISRQEFDAAVAASRAADADVAQIRAQVQAASLQLGYTTVRAPISGRAGRAQVTEGALVSQTEATLLTTIEQIDQVYVVFSNSAQDVLAIRRAQADGSLVLSEGGGVPVTLTLPDGSEYPISGTIDFLDQSVNEATGTVELRARFANPEGILLPGQFVRVQVEAGYYTNGIAVPQVAVTVTDKGGTVYVIDDEGKAQVRPVKLGAMFDDKWIIESGLKVGDKVITNNLQKLQPGAPVTIATPSPAPSRSPTPASAPKSAAPASSRAE
ncbi:efflux RND transporter periplasmic adaptor subunit [Aurantiacibacter xanthus]|uniref:Efflux RND transporter periplasmic adaptor subunit n=1 Tax=Aurantiacibacter xanthus TaxID=1784712 RepID=A0A3A1P7F5_9SPHN|nr:efflux RND transporter periplasmic adaptor subunit [Aurantiacibacter xanthus]RIV89545.1 efflux RND transporter periplasmic adaptor subunit [Aurantiacibacter xanthus]